MHDNIRKVSHPNQQLNAYRTYKRQHSTVSNQHDVSGSEHDRQRYCSFFGHQAEEKRNRRAQSPLPGLTPLPFNEQPDRRNVKEGVEELRGKRKVVSRI